MKAFQQGGAYLLTPCDDIDAAQASGEWLAATDGEVMLDEWA